MFPALGALDLPAPDLSRFQPSQLDPSVVSVLASRMAYSYMQERCGPSTSGG